MRKFYSFVLMAAALLIGTNAWAKTIKVAQVEAEGIDYTNLVTAFSKAETGDVIQLQSQMSLNQSIWIGEADQASTSGTGKVLTLDLNGNLLEYTGSANFIELTHGTLTIKGGEIRANSLVYPKAIVLVTGSTLKDCKPATQTNYYSHLVIENGATLTSLPEVAKAGYGIVVDNTKALSVKSSLTYSTKVYTGDYGISNGVRVDVSGKINAKTYGIKVNGNIMKPTKTDGTLRDKESNPDNADYRANIGTYEVAKGDTAYIPYINVANGAEVKVNETYNKAVAVYCAGYANYNLQGKIHGSTGVYVKSGNVEVGEGANIYSDNNTEIGIKSTGASSGVSAGGNAIAIESNANSYAGDINLEVSGGTVTAGADGYAIQNLNSTGSNEVQSVVISGGTFVGGANTIGTGSCITIDTSNGTPDVDLTGGTFTGGIETLIEAAGSDQIIQQVVNVDNNGNATVVIGQKETGDEIAPIPADKQDFEFVNDMSNDIVMLEADEFSDALSYTLPIGTTTVKYLSLTGKANSADPSAPYTTTVIVEDGKTLSVGQVVMNAYGKIIVKAGGKLIITGNNGLFADAIENIVLETQEGKPAIFLFNPEVGNNRNPKATVQFTSKSCYRYPAQKNIYQRFGIPMMKNGLESIECAGNHETRFFAFDYENAHDWVGIGYINPSQGYENDPLDITKLNDPFDYYQLLDFDATTPDGVIYTMKGSLLGNTEPVMQILANSWKGFANSYMGKMKLSELLDLIPNTVDKVVYTYDVNSKFASWEPVTNLNANANQFIDPMQPFLIRNRNAAANVELDYEATVYCPEVGCNQNPAPARSANNITMAKITIANENSTDYVIVAEGNEFTPSFDNGYDASKFMNDEVNLYVEAEENMSIFATNKLENTTLGVSSVLGGKYTITFSDVNGDNFVLVDNMTGAQIAMTEGSSYEFEMAANTVNNHRFEIVGVVKMPTAIENTAVKANAKGVYTLMGQYVGENINKLPAGVYVVNGVKIVK